MYKRILVPLDGSKRAEVILPHVEALARSCRATVIFARVIEPEPILVATEPVYPQFEADSYRYKMNEAEVYLTAWCGEFREKGIEARSSICHGPIVENLIDMVEQEDIDLIALASHGRTGLSRVIFGSVTAGLLHHLDRPILVIRSLND
ncbi:MAG: universal stress protein [Anaerolineales bacterium]|nr:universal stress protein [Anaerolineales bacterium]